jgi:hypothetical protein
VGNANRRAANQLLKIGDQLVSWLRRRKLIMKQEVTAFTSKVLEAAAHLCIVILMASAKLSQMALVFAPLGGGRQKRGKITMRILIWLFTTGWELCCLTFCQSVLTFAAWLSFWHLVSVHLVLSVTNFYSKAGRLYLPDLKV